MRMIPGIALLALAGSAAMAESRQQERIDAQLAAREPGAPLRCVPYRDLRGNQSAKDVLLFRGRRDILYVNRPTAGCPGLEAGRSIQTRTTASQLCAGDIVQVFDPVSGMDYGSCPLGEFVPYARPTK